MPRSAKKAQGRLQTYVVLLRGINVGGKTKISMSDLRTLLTGLGAEDVRTHLQSGNAVLVRTSAQLVRVVASNPFSGKAKAPAKVHVAFLAAAPGRARVQALDPKRSEPDEFRVAGREIYLYYPNGYGRTKINNAYFEKQLGVAATTRNWNTVTKLAELA